MGSLYSKNWGVVHIFIKYAWVEPLKDKTILNGFINPINPGLF